MSERRAPVYCAGKSAIPTRRLALKVAESMRRRHEAPLGAYRCDFCHAWHIGRPKPKAAGK